MRKVLMVAFTFLAGCAVPSEDSFQKIESLSLGRSEASIEKVQESLDSRTQIVLRNKEFQTPRRVERELQKIKIDFSVTDQELISLAIDHIAKVFSGYNLKPLNIRRGSRFAYVTFTQWFLNREIHGARLIVRLNGDGDWLTMNSSLIDPVLLQNLESQQKSNSKFDIQKHLFSDENILSSRAVIYPRKEVNESFNFYLAQELVTFSDLNEREVWRWIDETSGQVIALHDPAQSFDDDQVQVTGTIVPNTAGDKLIEAFFPNITAFSGVDKIIANHLGQFKKSTLKKPDTKIILENEFFSVVSNAKKDREFNVDASKVNELTKIDISEGPSIEERNVFYWLMFARDYLANKLKYDGMKYRLDAYTNYGHEFDNAFFMPLTKTLSFGAGGKFLKNTALSRDIVIHEFGHAVTQDIYGTVVNYEFNAMNEAFSDFLAASITNDPLVAEGALQERVNRPYLRTVLNTFVYPKDFSGKAFHEDGQMFSGALWDLRQNLGASKVEQMVHEARLAQAKTIAEFLKELLAIDEDQDDQNPFTASKNERAIWKAFKDHGLVSDVEFKEAPKENLTIPWKSGCLEVSEAIHVH